MKAALVAGGPAGRWRNRNQQAASSELPIASGAEAPCGEQQKRTGESWADVRSGGAGEFEHVLEAPEGVK